MLQTKYSAMESKSKELAMQQNASVSGATAALSGLHARLDNLVEQLVFSYNISEQDLEVGIFIYLKLVFVFFYGSNVFILSENREFFV